MVSCSSFLAAPLVAAQLFSAAWACAPPNQHDQNSTTTYPQVTLGPEGSDPATTGYFMNHFSFNVRNLTTIADFYIQVFGFRKLFTMRVSPHYSITYLGHSNGGKNGTGYQTTEELIRDQHNNEGLLELLFLDTPNTRENVTSSTERTNTFSHAGIIVPDIMAAQARLREFGVTIFKGVGETMPSGSPLNIAGGFTDAGISQLDSGEYESILGYFTELNKNVIFAADPEGNFLEVMPQEGAPVVQ
ncbi:hypothetical protein F4677DRAFT_317159 [Hypoxylon crocopeplum]|nr:hypothetical protein F4677DRAFT_317159 [Hypoxylon crocopeplum]